MFTPGGSEAGTRARSARRYAQRVHAGVPDRYGAPLLDHVRRVAAAVPAEARVVAWLHEVLEQSPAGEDGVRRAGATEDELEAVRLLTRDADACDEAYMEHVTQIARAAGRAGELARLVKVADLRDRVQERAEDAAGATARPDYDRALLVLAGAQAVLTG